MGQRELSTDCLFRIPLVQRVPLQRLLRTVNCEPNILEELKNSYIRVIYSDFLDILIDVLFLFIHDERVDLKRFDYFSPVLESHDTSFIVERCTDCTECLWTWNQLELSRLGLCK